MSCSKAQLTLAIFLDIRDIVLARIFGILSSDLLQGSSLFIDPQAWALFAGNYIYVCTYEYICMLSTNTYIRTFGGVSTNFLHVHIVPRCLYCLTNTYKSFWVSAFLK